MPNYTVIDLNNSEKHNHSEIVRQVLDAAQEFGFFQVINHGVTRKLMEDARSVFREFFEVIPVEEKSGYCSVDPNQKCILFTSNNMDYDKEEVHHWRDALRLSCTPIEECIKFYPQSPTRFREVVGEYVINVRELGNRILKLVCEGLGLEPGYLSKERS